MNKELQLKKQLRKLKGSHPVDLHPVLRQCNIQSYSVSMKDHLAISFQRLIKRGSCKNIRKLPRKTCHNNLQEISSKRYAAFVVIKKINKISLKTLLWFILCWCQFYKLIIQSSLIDIKIAWTELVTFPGRSNSIKEKPPFDMHISLTSKC